MYNYFLLIGRVKGVEFNSIKLLINDYQFSNGDFNKREMIIKVEYDFSFYEDMKQFLDENSVIGLNGRVLIDDNGAIRLVANKITFLE